ncbi:hypothetical protein KBB96_04340 [Luteolibacter ambystomatis]|uniref:LamG domain-containing protein n=1 Tax=Luteolibacter ambystomatis TaxID=2824561 RepID=A0A975J156_9BACT|nr:hypothetical protein [Luteolibacter ambystomatis]QUE52123.1 hypothetical protein KBB96_04340 [Luteolibacter ambystomatis]
MKLLSLLSSFASLCPCLSAAAEMPAAPILDLDLDAAKGITADAQQRVTQWASLAGTPAAKVFVQRDEGRKEPGSGRPTLLPALPALGGKPALSFRQQELVCLDEDAFDKLTTGSGHTWLAVIATYPQRTGLKDVNSFFGNLRNGEKYEGLWGCFNDNNTLWIGTRNSRTFGRFDANNPQVLGPKLEPGKFHVIAGRLGSGTGTVKLELFVDRLGVVASADFPVEPAANPSRMAVGQERDAIQHPGHESFDGEIARLMIFDRPLSNAELATALSELHKVYSLE